MKVDEKEERLAYKEERVRSLVNEIYRLRDKYNDTLKVVIRLANKLNASKDIDLAGNKEIIKIGFTEEEYQKVMEIIRRI